MPMEHKAYLFDYIGFAQELKPILEQALATRSAEKLVQFIDTHLGSLRHPDEGTTLDDHWRSLIEQGNPDEYGDFALTRYYVSDNIGLGYEWEEVQDIISAARPDLERSPLLGETIGPTNHLFDPGKLGSYFQPPNVVRANLVLVREIAEEWGEDLLASTMTMLETGDGKGVGLYVTF